MEKERDFRAVESADEKRRRGRRSDGKIGENENENERIWKRRVRGREE